jgi:hypothetical protein
MTGSVVNVNGYHITQMLSVGYPTNNNPKLQFFRCASTARLGAEKSLAGGRGKDHQHGQ